MRSLTRRLPGFPLSLLLLVALLAGCNPVTTRTAPTAPPPVQYPPASGNTGGAAPSGATVAADFPQALPISHDPDRNGGGTPGRNTRGVNT